MKRVKIMMFCLLTIVGILLSMTTTYTASTPTLSAATEEQSDSGSDDTMFA